MSADVFALVLLAALLHASWNALVKSGGDGLIRLSMVMLTGSVMSLPLVIALPLPAPESWPYLIASVVIHLGYYAFLLLGYRVGDLSQVYPIARGIAPLLVAILAFTFADETLNSQGVFAVVLICAAILSLALGPRTHGVGAKPVIFALLTGVTISAYTLVDGLGGRAAGNVWSYIAWLFLLEGVSLALPAIIIRGPALIPAMKKHWRAGVTGGVFATVAYALVIWAMSITPLTYVSALRETSVIAAAIIGTRLLREPLGTQRVAAASVVVAGVVLLQMSRTV